MIEVRKLSKIYEIKKRQVVGVDNVSLTIKKGDIFGIVGYSGAGKSSLLRCINLLEKPTTGEIIVDGQNLIDLSSSELRQARLKIGMIFQHFYLINQKTIAENIRFALKASHYPANKMDQRIDELLKMVGLSDKRDVYPSQLSGGQKQRVGIARALANNPSVLLCDEATSALDPKTTLSILKLLKEINERLGITIVLITHEMDVVKEICNRMAIMQDGRIVEEGEVYDIFASPKQALTQEFIQSVVSFHIPPAILQDVQGEIIQIIFKGDIAGEGIISDMLQQFSIRGNFLHGTIEYIQDKPLGIFIMELLGEKQIVEDAKKYLLARGTVVEVLQHV
ncbi:MAG: methionine ABC transporter ATP-binding protein [Solibacillus sp.]|uniref:methionine ABC transporter ATP-binding protein n=1 Tax=unclassified Solibacillus TaxID=2637870 RepID=UPI0030F59360